MKTYLSCPLPTMAAGSRVRVTAIAAGLRATRRLKDMGIIPGVEVRVIQSLGNGALILGVGDSRIAVERGIAHKVLVQLTTLEPIPEHPYTNDQEVPSCPIA
jgi:ferrous iron transport protein A